MARTTSGLIRFLTVFFCLTLVGGLIPVAAFAETGADGHGDSASGGKTVLAAGVADLSAVGDEGEAAMDSADEPAMALTTQETSRFVEVSTWEELRHVLLRFDYRQLTVTLPEGATLKPNTDSNTDTYLSTAGEKNVVIDLNGGTLDRGLSDEWIENGSVLKVREKATMTIRNGTICGGGSFKYGGGIANYGNLTLENVTITGCRAIWGGAIYNEGTLVMRDCTIESNDANGGGGVYNAASGTCEMESGTVTYNEAYSKDSGGGGFYNEGMLVLSGGIVGANIASGCPGAGIYNAKGGTADVAGSTIRANRSNLKGGGAYNADDATLYIHEGLFHGNRVINGREGIGGGIYNEKGGNIVMTGGTVMSNNALKGIAHGIYNDGTLNMSGAPVVIDNAYESDVSDVYLPQGKTITIDGALADNAQVNVVLAATTGRITTGYGEHNGTVDPANFFACHSSYLIGMSKGEAYIGTKDYGISIAASASGQLTANMSRAAEGRTVTLDVKDLGDGVPFIEYANEQGEATSEQVILNDDGVFSFVMPASDVMATVKYPVGAFSDDYLYCEKLIVYKSGAFDKGTDFGYFAPGETVFVCAIPRKDCSVTGGSYKASTMKDSEELRFVREDSDATYTARFNMRASSTTVSVTFDKGLENMYKYLLVDDGVNEVYVTDTGNSEITRDYAPTEWRLQPNYSWLVVTEDVEFTERIKVRGHANLLLLDGTTLTASSGIYVTEGSTLTIWAQSRNPETMGQLVVSAADGAGIGGFNGAAGSVTINGGKVTATGGANAAGIGGSGEYSVDGITINRGIVNATGGSGAAGIGSAKGTVNSITINGDDVFAEGGANAAGIGAGAGGHATSIAIGGGNVEAIGHSGAGIGYGGMRGTVGSVDISGGTTLATGSTFAIGSTASDVINLADSIIGVSPEKDGAYTLLDGAYFVESGEEPVKTVLVEKGYKVEVAEGVQNAQIEPDWSIACQGTKVTVSVDPNKGYACNELLVTLADGSVLALDPVSPNTFEFMMPAFDVILEADIYGLDAYEITVLDGAPVIDSSNMSEVANGILGSDVSSKYLELVVSPLKAKVPEDDKALLASKAQELGATAGTWFDLSLFVNSRKGDGHLEQLTTVTTPLALSLTVPEELRMDGRTFYVLSAHNGVAKIEAQGSGETLEWSSSDLSTFLLAYADEPSSRSEIVTISFDANGGSGTMDPIYCVAGESVTLAANGFTRSSYSFDGWNTAKDGKGTAYADKAAVKAKRDMTLYAQWKQTNMGKAAAIALATKGEKDVRGSTYAPLKLASKKQTETSVTLSWSKVKGAKRYVVYGSQCGKSSAYKELATVSGSDTSYVVKKIVNPKGKKVKLKAGTMYKFLVIADRGSKSAKISKSIHVATAGKENVANPINVSVDKKVLEKAKNLEVSKTLQLKAQAVMKQGTNAKEHVKIRYESSNKKIATVSSTGKVTGKKKGTCYIYAYAQNGICKAVKVRVTLA